MKAWLGILFFSLFGASAMAQTTYSYSGQNFTNADPPYTTSDRITGSFQLSAPLPPDAPASNISALIQDFSFSDGQATRTLANSAICDFIVSTNSSGGIQSYEIWLRQSDTGAMENQHSLDVRSNIDLAGFDINQGATGCGAIALTPAASNNNLPGLWTGGAVRGVPVPSLSLTALLLLAGAVVLIGFRHRG
jgi:hypothetical protein